MASPTINLNDSLPAASTNGLNVKWQAVTSVHDDTIENVSAYVPGDGDTTHFLRGDGTFAAPGGAGATPDTLQRTMQVWIAPGTGLVINGDTMGSMGTFFTITSNYPSNQPISAQYKNTSADLAGGVYGGQYWEAGNNTGVWGAMYLTRTTDTRFFFGLTDSIAAGFMGVDSPASHNFAMFRFSSIAGDTNHQCMCSDGTSTTIVNSGVAADTKQHRFAIQFSGSVVKFWIDGNLVATISTHLPTGVLNFYAGCAWHTSVGVLLGISCLRAFSDL